MRLWLACVLIVRVDCLDVDPCTDELGPLEGDFVSLLQSQAREIRASTTHNRTLVEQSTPSLLASILSFSQLLISFSAEAPDQMTTRIAWTVGGVTLLIFVLLPLIIIGFGGLAEEPQLQLDSKRQAPVDVSPPFVITFFSGVVSVGIVANVTILIPVGEDAARSVGQGIMFSGFVLGTYSIGALLGLAWFRFISISDLRKAYLAHALFMLIGNFTYACASVHDNAIFLFLGRLVTGFEGGCMYNTAAAMVHFTKGAARTRYLVLYQFFVALGCILGPVLAGICVYVGEYLRSGSPQYCANSFMILWGGFLLVTLWMYFPKDARELESLAWRRQRSDLAEASDAELKHGLAALLSLVNAACLRMFLRLVWESGATVILMHEFDFQAKDAGLSFGVICGSSALSQYIFSQTVAGKFPDWVLMRFLEIGQICGILLMFVPGKYTFYSFMFGSIIAYSCNAIWAGVSTSFCLKRALPGTFFCKENLLAFNQAAIFVGIWLGCVVSRSILDLKPTRDVLASILLAGALLELWFSLLTISRVS